MGQHVKLSDVSLGTRLRYSLVADEDVKKPNKQESIERVGVVHLRIFISSFAEPWKLVCVTVALQGL